MKKRRLSKRGKFILLVLAIILLGITFLNVLLIKKIKYDLSKDVNQIAETEKYTMKISYPITHNKEIDKKIVKYVTDKKSEFIEETKNSEDDFKYDFIADYNYDLYNNIKYIHQTIYTFTGGNHYIRDDQQININAKSQVVKLEDYFNVDNYLDTIAYYSKLYLEKYFKENEIDYDEEWVDEGLKTVEGNYQFFAFNEDGLKILFVPYQVGPWAVGEISITIPYKDLNSILKDENKKQEVEDVITKPDKRNISTFKDKKLLALTFDDGPNGLITERLIDGLNERGARATFFMLGNRVVQYPEVVKKVYESGNDIGSHSYSHRNLINLDENDLKNEIVKTDLEIESIIGIRPTLLRPPYGSYNDEILTRIDKSFVLWNVDTEDWKIRNIDSVSQNIVNGAKDGNIMVLHDLYNTSIDGALKAIDMLKEEGYEFVTISELSELRDKPLVIHNVYFKF